MAACDGRAALRVIAFTIAKKHGRCQNNELHTIFCMSVAVAGLLFVPHLTRAQDAVSALAQKQIGAAKTEMVLAQKKDD